MGRASDRADLRKAEVVPQVFSVRRAERTVSGKAREGVRVFSVLAVRGTGEPALARIAAAQHGIVHRRQLAAVGIGRHGVRRRVRDGRLHPRLPGVFAVGYPRTDEIARLVAGLLYVGEDCVVSHRSAAALWELAPVPEAVHLTRQGLGVHPRPGLRVRRVAALDVRDVRLHRGLPVTAPARALLDLAADADDGALERALAQARMRRLVTDGDLDAALGRSPSRPGARRLRRVMAAVNGAVITRSAAERLIRRLVAAAGLPMPETNAHLLGYEVDFLWREQKLILEMDGFEFHRHRHQFESDRRRDQLLTAAGYRVIRVTWRQLRDEPVAIAVRIAQALVVG